jgi:hypothetical protein
VINPSTSLTIGIFEFQSLLTYERMSMYKWFLTSALRSHLNGLIHIEMELVLNGFEVLVTYSRVRESFTPSQKLFLKMVHNS